MTQFLQALVEGMSLAAIYALIGLGFVIIYKSTQVFNFAQPALLLLGAYWVVYLAGPSEEGGLAWPFWIAMLLAAGLAASTGVVVERVALRPMVGKPVFAVAIMTIGLDVVISVMGKDLLGTDARSLGSPWKVGDVFDFEVFGSQLAATHRQVAAMVAAVLLVTALLAFFRYSRFGLAMRAAAFDQEVALTQGISVTAVFAASWAIASVLAMVSGVFIGAGLGLTPSAAFIALKALPVVVIGGLDSVPGALVGAVIVGVAEAMTFTFQPEHAEFLGNNFSQVVPYVVMFVVLLVRPYGLFGTKEVERV